MNIGKIEEAVILLKQAPVSFTEVEKKLVALYAFKTCDDELIQKLVEELSEKGADKSDIFQKYYAIADEQDRWIDQVESILVSLELLRLKEKEALDWLFQIVKAYEKEIADKAREDAQRETECAETKETVPEKISQQRIL